MALHTITLDDLELTALNILLEGESEIMVESRLNTTGNVNPDRREVLINLVYCKVFDAVSYTHLTLPTNREV